MNVKNSVRTIDNYVKRIDSLVKTFDLPINIIFLSDHGMIGIDSEHILTVPVIDKNKFVVNNQKTMINLYAKDRSYIQDTYTQLRNNANGNYQVYLSDTLPEGWYYGGVNDDFKRAGDIIIVAKKQYIFGATSAAGVHGYTARGVEEMRATFSAWGPSFKKGVKIKPFENVEIYQLLAEILGLKPANNDGKGTLSSQVLQQ
jgi:predicted AlkP superfamily pyrophosphatase or phosphodiesterase